ncbi:PolA DNA polymerase I - 3'-5' exonuclease and polymerase domains [uncultured Caudovirales phage]|uniref:PolA DNA polymerase I - 3'-5' exonuclease and polymerase domains n=1 Tax=uncultured Caudovirales phage TaxID=2100421 RepID=A0A6J5SR27_9CAUD|nr:PolA DNA polymerase I - 3'-5' exonuclease and polymerase domains [uncultured Caudovirales phage]CAB4167090.1 PolA DNA polymerase I - 3'-5' exonuclease and polymerase domains [uncultured Caudovirales phage]CAB4174794.1 PolA DNA polymerase I - 3'-5' exonuclease and polymerase domains [uncultured Caudovirales phage]CAB4180735.1 PolA DNA polymerase I - 3'-5' exonuclease and polymerase domains [uncultured Caudovirales phage]CAB4186292.1 PolA DNA polymerase I - 3'-5' exonuclease and polymerase dom
MPSYSAVTTMEALEELTVLLAGSDVIAIDTETTGLSHYTDRLVGISVSVKEQEGYYIPLAHLSGDQIPLDVVRAYLKPVLCDASKSYVMFNAKFDTRFLASVDLCPPYARIVDAFLEAYCAAEGFEEFSLKGLVKAIWGIKTVEFKDLFSSKTKSENRRIDAIPIELASDYAAADADYTLRLHNRYYEKVKSSFIFKMESELWPFIQQLEDNGASINNDFLYKNGKLIREVASYVDEIVHDQAAEALGQRIAFSTSNPHNLSHLLYDLMGIPVKKTSATTGKPSVDKMTLEMLEPDFPIVRNILTVRSMERMAQLLDEQLPSYIAPDGRIHTSYNQAGATTGRFGSSNPNLQNQPRFKSWAITLPDGSTKTFKVAPRDAFVAEDGHYLIELDFRQIEFIIMAHLSGDAGIVQAYLAGEDVHIKTASELFRVPESEVTKEQRTKAKTLNYLIIYGGGANKLAALLGIDERTAEEDIQNFFRSRPKFISYMQKVRDAAKQTKTVRTFFGRVQVVPEFYENSRSALAKAERASVNRIIQGSAADYQKIGIIRAMKRVAAHPTFSDKAKMILQTHDSQTWQVSLDIAPDEIIPFLIDAMSVKLDNFPRITVDAQVGYSWGRLTEWEEGKTWDFQQQRKDYENSIEEKEIDVKSLFAKNDFTPEEKSLNQQETVEKSTLDEQISTAINVVIEIKQEVSKQNASDLASILRSFPGKNTIIIVTGDGTRISLEKFPTSLSTHEMKIALADIFPLASYAEEPIILRLAKILLKDIDFEN